VNNPYVSRGPVRIPEMFFGRKHELNEVAAFLRGNQSVSIIGSRKIGKTSLLFHLMRPEVWPSLRLEEDNLFVYLDCEVLGEGSHEEMFGLFAWEMSAALDERGLPEEPALARAIDKPTRLSFEGAVRKLNRRGLRIVLILDEFERLSTNADLNVNFFNALRSAAGRYQLAFLTASARPLIELTYSGRSQEILSSPFFNIFAPLFLGMLAEDEAHQLIEAPAQREGLSFSPDMLNAVYGLAGGHPFALQVACFHAFETLDNPGETGEIENRVMRELRPHFAYYWQNLSQVEQKTLQQLSMATSRADSDTTMRGVLRDLTQKCLLVRDEMVYRYPSRAWEKFVAAQSLPPATILRTGGELTGAQLGVYQVLDRIGRGGMSEVYRGRHPRLERTVAIKVLPTSLASEGDFRDRFEREARSIATLRHANIVQVFDFGDEDGLYYMVIEYIDGKDLTHYMQQSGPMPLTAVRPLARDIAGALDYAHAQGLVHRDVKPSNVMLQAVTGSGGSELRAILTDFGIAKIRTGSLGATQTGTLMGTLDYMAPEQIDASGDVDGRVDVYALGVMLYQMLSGELPFKGDNPGAILIAHLQDPIPDPRTLVPDMPEPAATAIMRAMAKNRDDRFSTAGELVGACK